MDKKKNEKRDKAFRREGLRPEVKVRSKKQ
jgi:hypothetical protein